MEQEDILSMVSQETIKIYRHLNVSWKIRWLWRG